MKYCEVVELPTFQAQASALLTDEELEALITDIATNPIQGAVMPGTGGLRKTRFGRGDSGKSGGVRVIFYYWHDEKPVFLLLIYAKGRKETLSASEKTTLKKLTKSLRDEYE